MSPLVTNVESTSTSTHKEDITTGLAQNGSTLFSCRFDRNDKKCNISNTGKEWNTREMFNNHYLELEMDLGDKTEFFFQQLIEPPPSGIACLDFRYKKLSSGGSESRLTVFAWPRRGKPGRVTVIQDSPDDVTWVRAQVTFRNVGRQFLILFRAKNTLEGESLLLAVDDVTVTEGPCQGGGRPRN